MNSALCMRMLHLQRPHATRARDDVRIVHDGAVTKTSEKILIPMYCGVGFIADSRRCGPRVAVLLYLPAVGESETADPLVGQLVDGRWRIVDRLGAGGMGVVYRAERVKLGKMVALKFLDERGALSPDAVKRFEREARAISRVQHRHCVSILDFGVHARRPYIVMEYLSGRPLSREMGRPTLTPRRAVQILLQMLKALEQMHSNNVVHRDLKPDNVMLIETTGTADFVKILDFGLARIISLDEPTLSQPEFVAGTPSYMSPEQCRGEKTDHRSDLYSAGVILYGMCVGKKPFRSDDGMEVMRMHMNAPVPLPRKVAPERNLSAALERVILRAMEKDRDKRFYYAAEFLAALEATPEAKAVRPSRARRIARMVVAVGLIAAGATGAILARPYLAARATTAPAPVAAAPAVAAPAVAAPAPVAAPPVVATAPSAPPEPAAAPAPAPEPAPAPAPSEKVPEPVAAATTPVTTTTTDDDEPTALSDPPKVEPKPAPVPEPQMSTKEKVAKLLDGEKLAEAEKQLLAEQILSPKAGWVHLDLGEIYFRRLWRKDAEREWTQALKLEPSLKRDPRLADHLCATLGKQWKGTGERLAPLIGAPAVPSLESCARDGGDVDRAFLARRLADRLKHR
jgi:serine/threonine-protein kinase